MSGAYVLILSLGFKFMRNTETLGYLNVPFRVSYNTYCVFWQQIYG